MMKWNPSACWSWARWAGFLILVIGMGMVGMTSSSHGEIERQTFGGALPLWEPAGSPVLMLPGAVMYPPVDTPRGMVAADITGDGRAELIVGGDYLHVLSLRDGEIAKRYLTVLVGVKQFVGPGEVRLGVGALAAGDMDGDGRTDLVVATHDGKLWVLGNHAQWGFQWRPGSPYPVSGNYVWLFDHDGDGYLDVILGGGFEVTLLRGDGTGRLGEPEAIVGPEGRLRAGAEGRYAGARGLFLLTDQGLWFLGQGEHAAERALDRGGWGLAVGGFTGSGVGDVAIGRREEVWVYPEREGGLGEPTVLRADHIVAGLLAGDLNGDGIPDLVAGSSSPGGFSVFYSRPGQGFMGPYWHGVEVPAMRGLPAMAGLGAVGDLTGDGRDDLAVATILGYIAFFHSEPRGRSLQAIPGSFLLGSVDINGDGYPDLLTSTAQGGVAVLQNSGWGTFTAQKLVGPSGEGRSPYIIQFGDVTGDGADELVVFEFAEDRFLQRQADGTVIWGQSKARATVWDISAQKVLWSEPLGQEIRPLLILSDQTGDGIEDVVTAVGDEVIVLGHDPAEPPARQEIAWDGPVGPLVLVRLAVGEAIVGFRVGLETELLLLREGEVQETEIKHPLAPLDLVAADMNDDGNEDLVTVGWGALEEGGETRLAVYMAILRGDGTGGFVPELFPLPEWPVTALPFPYGGLVVADLNGDGRRDIAVMRLPDQAGTPGGIVILTWTEAGLGKPVFLPGCLGTKFLALDADGDGLAELASVAIGIPAQLCLTSWR